MANNNNIHAAKHKINMLSF